METLGWSLRRIFLPLLPFICGALIRTINSGSLGIQSFNGAELSFSMALLSILVLESLNRQQDNILRNSWGSAFIAAISIFLVLFALQVYESNLCQKHIMQSLNELNSMKNMKQPVNVFTLSHCDFSAISDSQGKQNMMWWITVVFSLFIGPMTIAIKAKYKLDD
jgi:hypothetical protein